MKTLLTFALLALMGLLHHNSAAIKAPGTLNEVCCPRVTQSPIPREKIKNVVRSHSKCQVPAIIVTTVCKKKFCLDGNWTWAENLLTDFERSPSVRFNTSPCRKEARKL